MNLDGDEPTDGPVGRLLSENGDAILFVWRHRGHLGRIRISAHSKESLNQRAKAQGTTALAEAIRAHIPSDAPGHGPMGPPALAQRAAWPPQSSDTGGALDGHPEFSGYAVSPRHQACTTRT